MSAESARAGAEVEQAIGAGDDFLIVLDDEQRVAEVAQFCERDDQAGIVARVQADRGFVEHVQHAAQAAADLAGEADALGFAAGERGRAAAEREVIEADVDQEREAIVDFADELAGDLLFAGGEFPFLHLSDEVAQGRAADLVERAFAEAEGGRVIAQAAAAAFAAIDFADKMLEQLRVARGELRGFFERGVEAFVLEVEDRAIRLRIGSSISFWVLSRRRRSNLRPCRTGRAALAWRQIVVRHVDRHARVCGERGEHGLRNGEADVGPNEQRAFRQREVCIAQQRGRVRAGLRAEAFARRAPAERTVEREIVRLERLETAAALVAGEMLAVDSNLPARLGHIVVWIRDVHHAFAKRERVFDAAGDAGAGVGPNDDAVDHDFDNVLAAAVDGWRFR